MIFLAIIKLLEITEHHSQDDQHKLHRSGDQQSGPRGQDLDHGDHHESPQRNCSRGRALHQDIQV